MTPAALLRKVTRIVSSGWTLHTINSEIVVILELTRNETN